MPTTTSSASPTEHPAHQDPHQHAATASRSWQPGRVAWFDAEKGFGFLTPDRGGPTVFCDYTAIDSPGYKTLHAGQCVVFTVTDTSRGPEAVQVLTYGAPITETGEPSPMLPSAGSRPVPWPRWMACRGRHAA